MRDWQADWHQTAGHALLALISGGKIVRGSDVVGALGAIVPVEPGATPAPLTSPGTPASNTAHQDEDSFSPHGPVFERTTGLSEYGTIRPRVSGPGKPGGEVTT